MVFEAFDVNKDGYIDYKEFNGRVDRSPTPPRKNKKGEEVKREGDKPPRYRVPTKDEKRIESRRKEKVRSEHASAAMSEYSEKSDNSEWFYSAFNLDKPAAASGGGKRNSARKRVVAEGQEESPVKIKTKEEKNRMKKKMSAVAEDKDGEADSPLKIMKK